MKAYIRKFQEKTRKIKLFYYLRHYHKTVPNIELADVKSIALLRWDGKLGDTIIMGAFISLMEKYRPDINITVLAHGFSTSWIKKINNRVTVLSCGKRSARTARELQKYEGKFDAVIDLSSEFTYKELLALKSLKAKINIGYDHKTISIADVKVPNNIQNFKDRYIYTAQMFIKQNIDGSKVKLPTPNFESKSFSNKDFSQQIAINLFGATSRRQFTYDSAKKLLSNWLEEWPNEILVLIPVPNFLEFLKKLTQEINNDRLILPDEAPSIEQSLGIISSSSLCFTPDTSVVHMASCLNTPTLAIFSADTKNYQEWKPSAEKAAVIFNPASSRSNEKTKVDDFPWSELVERKNTLLS